jgi:hypothetical protein
MGTRKRAHLGCTLAIAWVLLLVLACGLGTVAVQQRVVQVPRVNLSFGGVRVMAYTQTIRTRPPQYFYIIWVFTKTASPIKGAPATERGEQLLQVQLKPD